MAEWWNGIHSTLRTCPSGLWVRVPPLPPIQYGTVTQLVECLPEEEKVAGSSPAGSTKQMRKGETLKVCGCCLSLKDLSKFSKKSSSKDGHSSKCKDCHNEYVRTKWYPKNKDQHIASVASYKKSNPHKIISFRYGISEDIVESVMSKGFCQICGKTENLVFDHIHLTNTARGCLCTSCNTMLGRLGDTNEQILARLELIRGYVS